MLLEFKNSSIELFYACMRISELIPITRYTVEEKLMPDVNKITKIVNKITKWQNDIVTVQEITLVLSTLSI